MNSPFVFGSTVSGKAFTNRTAEISWLQDNLLSGINSIIISPRRWGKSSLVEHVTKKIQRKDKGIVIIGLDLFSISSQEEFLSELARRSIKAITTKPAEWARTVKEVFQHLIPRLVINTEAGDFTLEFDIKRLNKHREEILNLPEYLAEKTRRKVILCIDEFQNVRNYIEGIELEKSLRAYWQWHKHVTYCLYGSKRHMMTEIFNKSSNPFYKFGDLLMLTKIDQSEWVTFIEKSFKQTKKFISEQNATLIAKHMEGHPWYVQQLAHYVWLKTDKQVAKAIVDGAMQDIVATQLPFFQLQIEKLSRTQVNLLKAILHDENQFTATRVMSMYGLGTPNNVRKNLKVLADEDIIDKQQNQYRFLDPVFKKWLEDYFG